MSEFSLLITLLALGCIGLCAYRYADAHLARRPAKRPDIPVRTWIKSEDTARCAAATEALEIIATRMNVRSGQLRPSDRFSVELAYSSVWKLVLIDDPLNGVEDDILQMCLRHGIKHIDVRTCHTLRALIDALCQGNAPEEERKRA